MAVPQFVYCVRYSGSSTFLPEVKSPAMAGVYGSEYAGVRGKSITDVAIKVVGDGEVEYRVHVKGYPKDKWLPVVYGKKYNPKDGINGFAGNGQIIDAIQIKYTPAKTVDGLAGGTAYYRVSPVNKDYYPEQRNNVVDSKNDGYAGCYGVAIDKFQIRRG